MSITDNAMQIEPYVLLRSALAIFEKTPDELDKAERTRLVAQAKKEQEIESLILSSSEAVNTVVSDHEVNKALEDIQQRFEDEASFHDELARNALTLESLTEALRRQCKVENVMELVASRAAKISEVDVGIYYYEHPDKFKRDEHRSARHILVTINEDMPENTRDKALERIQLVARKLNQNPDSFGELALRYSECPSALQNGELGSVPQGRLFPEIDEVLFKLQEGQISQVIETEVGFHIVACDQIHPREEVSLKTATPQIQIVLEERAKRVCQRVWLAELSTKRADDGK